MKSYSALALAVALTTVAVTVSCRPASTVSVSKQEAAENAFEKAAHVVLPTLTLSEARSIDWLVEGSPGQFDSRLNDVYVQCTFEGEQLALGRVGVEGTLVSSALLPLLIELHGGEPTAITDAWVEPETGNTRPERKWAFPNGTDLVEHEAYTPKGDEDADRFMPSETVLRVGS